MGGCCFSISLAFILLHPASNGSKDDETKTIDLHTLILFHKKLAHICNEVPLRFVYEGPLAKATNEILIVKDALEEHLSWAAITPDHPFAKDPKFGRVLFYLSISTHKRLDSLGYVEIEKKRLYVQAKFREKNKPVDSAIFPDEKNSDISKITLRQFIQDRLLEK